MVEKSCTVFLVCFEDFSGLLLLSAAPYTRFVASVTLKWAAAFLLVAVDYGLVAMTRLEC